ncbi:uncharacterized protein LOC113381831 [Ctenocephalides felis]|uniref:uncharacterized protein LOC113381831 n=1 Tax=Ctenocephalides felis TaxID=7515 RepID=UPI000E6E1FC1|nr:uncharacterized protein LOC113381831 [Ctenocephalides felis]
MLGICAAWKGDLQATVAEMVYGEALRLPGPMLHVTPTSYYGERNFMNDLRNHMQKICPTNGTRHGQKITAFSFDGPKRLLQNPYEGPFEVKPRSAETFVVCMHGKNVTISIDRMKPACTLAPEENAESVPSQSNEIPQTIRLESDNNSRSQPLSPTEPEPIAQPNSSTRRGRRVRFPDFSQAGFL